MTEILHTTPAHDWFAIFIDIDEGVISPVPVMLWATIKENGRQEIVGAIDPSDYTTQLTLLTQDNKQYFWRYVMGDMYMPSQEETAEEVEFERKQQIDKLIDEFLEIAVEQKIISEEFSAEIASEINYPFIHKEKTIYRAIVISWILEREGISKWQDQPEKNEKVKQLYSHWSRWHNTRYSENEYSFTENEVKNHVH